MTEQVNFICWKSDVVSSTIPTEAATPSDEVLLATHAPLRITRRGGVGADAATALVSEQQVLDDFLTASPNNGVLVASVLGESGAGKSHLVRWVNAKIPAKSGRHRVYLQKTETSLKDVVEALLVGQTDPEFDELRRKVSGLGRGMTLDEMEHKLLAELAEALRTAEPRSGAGKALVGDNGLRLFFTDRLFEQHLLRDGSFFRRRAEHALRGRNADEDDVPLEFTAEELPLDIATYGDVSDAGAATQRLFRLLMSNQTMQAEAVRLINDNLDVAVMKAASLAVGDIGQAFKRIREKLVGQEIVLLIEDVALIQGVRRDLLDAIIEVGVVQGEERYATVRTLMAVTPGYYRESLPETFRRRSEATSPTYTVDVDLDGTAANDDDLIDFVGRYLNSARVGKDLLEKESPAVRNACMSCPVQDTCHATFGTSRQEYGLYPFNRAAVLRAIRACAEKDPGRDHAYFNPRKVLSRAVRNVLVENISSIEGGMFPPGGLLGDESAQMGLPRLPVAIREQIEEAFAPEEASRLEALVTFWGSAGTEPVSDDVLRAFSHPPVPTSVYGGGARSVRRDDSGDAPRPSLGGIPNSVQRDLEAIDAWSEGKVLPDAIAREIRSITREALLGRIDWFDVVMKEPDAATIKRVVPDNARSVSIDGANENIARAGVAPLLQLDRSPRMAVTFKGLLLIKAGYAERAGEALPRVDALVVPAVNEVKRRIRAELQVTDEDLVGAAASLLRGAAVCGTLPERPSELDCINACLWQDTEARADASSRLDEWTVAYNVYRASRGPAIDRLLAGLGAAQGAGGVHAIDFTRFSAIVRRARVVALSEDPLVLPEWAKDTDNRLAALTRLSKRQLEHWRGLVNRVRAHMPEGSLTDTLDAIASAVREGQLLGLVRVNDLREVEDRNAAARGLEGKCVIGVERVLEASAGVDGMELHRLVGAVVGGDLQALADYLDYTGRWIDAGLLQARSDGGAKADVDQMLDDVLRAWETVIGEAESNE